jgi:predicted DNA-binding transcriptional regulator AlpA
VSGALIVADREIQHDNAIAARTVVPVVCLVADILRIFAISESTFYKLRRERRFPIEPMASIDSTLRFSGFDVLDYVRRRGAPVQDVAKAQPSAHVVDMRTNRRRRFFGKATAHR